MLTPVRPAAPIRAKYDERLTALIGEMHRSIMHWVKAEYRRNTPETVIYARDDDPVKELQRALNTLGKRWLHRFDQLSESLAEYFAKAVRDRTDRSLMADLRKSGFTVRFKMTPAMRDAFNAVRAENVGLIRSIAQQHLAHVETLVMQSASRGGDLGTLSKALTKTYGVTKRRAAFIAHDQNSKATAALTRARHLEIGITKARWMHSAGGKVPRPAHVAFSGKVYDIREGHDFGDGEGPCWPGTPVNCRCVASAIVPGFD